MSPSAINWPVFFPPEPTPPEPVFPSQPQPTPVPPQIPTVSPQGPRKDIKTRILLDDGTALELRALSGLLIDDILIQGAKAEGYRVMTGKDVFPVTGRDIKDYLFRLGFVTE